MIEFIGFLYMLPILDVCLIILFLSATLVVGLCLKGKDTSAAGYLLGGRTLTLPAFVATTVSTWYGGILGVGEYGWTYGISNWLVFGVPYYVGAFLFAILLCRRARRGESLTLPERLEESYGAWIGKFSAVLVFLTSMPAAYMLIMGTLLSMTLGVSPVYGIVATALYIVIYLWRGGFSAVTKTDYFQCIMMFLGFMMLTGVLIFGEGASPLETLPESHWAPTGGQPIGSVLVWYIIALSTLAEPNFFQRAFAAKTPDVARKGLLVSILCWIIFDAMTTICGLYARALLPDLDKPLLAFPKLAVEVLPSGLLGIFFIGMFATVMSTLDSNLFTVATTFGCDIFSKKSKDLSKKLNENCEKRAKTRKNTIARKTRIGLILAAILSSALAICSDSVVSLWKIFGSISASALLIPIISTYYPPLRMSASGVFWLMSLSSLTTFGWFCVGKVLGQEPFGVEPLFAGGTVSLIIFMIDKFRIRKK